MGIVVKRARAGLELPAGLDTAWRTSLPITFNVLPSGGRRWGHVTE